MMINPFRALNEGASALATLVRLFAPKDPKARARSHRARADHLQERADGLAQDIRTHEINLGMPISKSRRRYHLRVMQRQRLKRSRLLDRVMWWRSRADILDPPTEGR